MVCLTLSSQKMEGEEEEMKKGKMTEIFPSNGYFLPPPTPTGSPFFINLFL